MAWLLIVALTALRSDDASQQLEFLRLSYKANKEAFSFGTFRFEYTRGSSASRQDAEAGVFSSSINEQGFYVFDGKNARYDLIAAPTDLAAKTTRVGERRTMSSAKSFRMLTDGEATLLDTLLPDQPGTNLVHARP